LTIVADKKLCNRFDSQSVLPAQPTALHAPANSDHDAPSLREPTTIVAPRHAIGGSIEIVVPPVAIEGHARKTGVEVGVRSSERKASPSLDEEYKDDDERARSAKVRAEHPLLSIPSLRLLAAAATGSAINQLAPSSVL
jgi:hypothetical protein